MGSKRMFCCFVRESETVVQVRMSYWEPEAGVRVTQVLCLFLFGGAINVMYVACKV